jgi:uncharacterized protein
MLLPPIAHRIASELSIRINQATDAIALLDDGASVPFIARYRKEATGGLDDTQLRSLEERLGYLRELEARRAVILASVDEQGKMTPALREQFEAAQTKQRLEDLYLPFKPKRRTKAQIARKAGLEPLAQALFNDPFLVPEIEAARYVCPVADVPELVVPDVKAALDGARQILMERFAEQAPLLDQLRSLLCAQVIVVCTVVPGKETEGAKYQDWFDFQEPYARIPSHRVLALLRGRNEGILRVGLKMPQELAEPPQPSPGEALVCAHFGLCDRGRAADRWLLETARWAWSVKLSLHLELELMGQLRERAEEEAIRVFARNLQGVLLAAPAGPRVTLGLDPGIRTGVKAAVVDATGKLLETATIYPFEPRCDEAGALVTLSRLVAQWGVEWIAIGNGTASRETDKLAGALITTLAEKHPQIVVRKVMVSEAGASVYSASERAATEFPDLDVSLRGAVSIARRFQDPLAELVKIDPKSIGVGQYQHDVNPVRLARSLDAVVEDCVNAVGVDVNTASVPLLARVSGLNTTLATHIVSYRDSFGPFKTRNTLKKVPRLGDKTFEQAAGFLRIASGENPLDASAVHPESYPLVERMLADIGCPAREVIGQIALLRKIVPERYTDARFGLPTVRDILRELEKPGRDPRPQFEYARFRDDVSRIQDVKAGMVLEGTITNVTNFGAFVDIGVHQDGLVHISALSDRYVRDPHTLVRAGDVVRVKVIDVDIKRKRMALSMRMGDEPRQADTGDAASRRSDQHRPRTTGAPAALPSAQGAMQAAFARLKSERA